MTGSGPLAGVRIADFTWVWAGPFCTLQLAHLGAEVIRIESHTRICVTRLLPPWPPEKVSHNTSGYFNQYNQGKRSLSLDLKRPEATEIARRLVARSDVVAENFAPGVMDRFGLGYEALRAVRPDIVMVSLSGYGATGPERDYVSYGPAQVPLSGLSSLTGYRGAPPMHVGISYGDPTAGLHAAVAVIAALLHRDRTGEGQYIDLSQWESLMALLPEGIMAYTMNREQPTRQGNRDPWMAPHGIFRCAGEDRWVSIAVADDDEWRRFCAATAHPELAADPRFATAASRKENEDALDEQVTAWTSPLTPEEVTARLQAADIAAFPAMNTKELAEDPHLNQRGYIVEIDQPAAGRFKHTGIPWKMSATACVAGRPAPCLGQDTDAIMQDILGYTPAEIARLREDKVLH